MELTTIHIPVIKRFAERDERWIETATNMARLQQARREIEAQEKILAEVLRDLSMGESSEGGQFRYEKIMRKGTVEYKSIPELQGVDLDAFRGQEIESWKLTVRV